MEQQQLKTDFNIIPSYSVSAQLQNTPIVFEIKNKPYFNERCLAQGDQFLDKDNQIQYTIIYYFRNVVVIRPNDNGIKASVKAGVKYLWLPTR